MFINSQVGLLSSEKLANSAVLAAGLSQASGSAGGIIQSTGEVFGGSIGAAVSALSEKHLAGVKEQRSHCGYRRPSVANCDCVLRCTGSYDQRHTSGR
jgi:hypothetical protein